MASYPAAIASFSTKYDFTDVVFAAHINDLQAEVVALQSTLGLLPHGASASVRARLDAMSTTLSDLNSYFSGGLLPVAGVATLEATLTSIAGSLATLTSGLATEITNRGTGDANVLASIARSAHARYRGANQVIDNNLWTPLDCPSTLADYSHDGWADPLVTSVTPSGEIRRTRVNLIAPEVDLSIYIISASCTFGTNATGIRGIRVITAGGSVIQQSTIDADITGSDRMAITVMVPRPYEASYYYEVQVYQNSGGVLSLTANTSANPFRVDAAMIPVG